MEGLEITEILLSELSDNNEVLRIDAEYFGKSILTLIHQLQAINAQPLASLATITDGIHTSLPFVEDGDVKVLSAKHPKDNFIDTTQFETITTAFHEANPRTALRENDVLLSTVGTIGNSAVVTRDILPANSDRHIGIIRLRNDAPAPLFISTFLVSKYGRAQSVRETTGNVQPNLFISKIGRLLVPRFSSCLEAKIVDLAKLAYEKRKHASKCLQSAEQTLLHFLGLDTWTAPESLSFVRSSSEAFAAGRLDSQYFAPRVDELMKRLGRDGLRLGDVAPSRHERFTPDDKGLFNYIEIGGLGADGTATAETLAQSEAPSRATQYVRAGDVITSTVRPIRRLSALVSEEQDENICSSGFVVLIPKEVSGEVLLTYLRLPLICELMDLHTSATMYPTISEADLLALPIPRIDASTQATIQELVRGANSKRENANNLLSAAKQAVEIAIEESEAAAVAYLDSIVE